ncbi:MAG: rubrerythrin family protein [Promethearchaeota archaeon]
MPLIIDNLKEAINGESNAKRKYELFAKQAARENFPEIANLFKAISSAEGIHIKNHLKALSVITGSEINPKDFVKIDENELKSHVKNTKSNLIDAINGETFETKKMYKQFVKNSKKEGYDAAELTFTLAQKAERVHARIYSKFLKILEKNKLFRTMDIYVCQICGNVEFEKAPSICPLCEHTQKFFKKIEP